MSDTSAISESNEFHTARIILEDGSGRGIEIPVDNIKISIDGNVMEFNGYSNLPTDPSREILTNAYNILIKNI